MTRTPFPLFAMRHVLPAFLALLTLSSCVGPQSANLDPTALQDSLPLVVDRYLAYVQGGVKPDGTPLTALERDVWVATGEQLLETFQVALDAKLAGGAE